MAITDPTDITGLLGWYQGDDINEKSGVERMFNKGGTWVGESDNGDLAQSIIANRPTQIDIDGILAVNFDRATSDNLATFANLTAYTRGTIAGVFRMPGPSATFETMFAARPSGAGGLDVPTVWKNDSDELVAGTRDGFTRTEWASASPVGWDWDEVHVVVFTFDIFDSDMEIRIDGTSRVSVAGSPNFGSAGDGLRLGRGHSNHDHSDLACLAIVAYDSVLTGTDLTDLESWLTTNFTGAPGLPPVADAGPDQSVFGDVNGNVTVTLDGTGSSDPDGTIDNYLWEEGKIVLANGATESGPTVELSGFGNHSIKLTVTDNDSNTAEDFVDILVKSPQMFSWDLYQDPDVDGVTDFLINFEIFPDHVEKAYDQIRVLKKTGTTVTELFPVGRPAADGTTDFSFDDPAAPTKITLDTALVTGDVLIIMRETRMDKPVASIRLTGGSRFRASDMNTRGDQILYICQELRALRDIADVLGSGDGEEFEYEESVHNTGAYSQTHIADGVATTFSYDQIEMLPKSAVNHATQLVLFVNGLKETFTLDEATLLVTPTNVPAADDEVIIQRVTRINARWVNWLDAQTFSALLSEWDFKNVKFIIEETPDFPTFLLDNPLDNRIHGRAINEVIYSGPGDRFFFGNLPWFGDGSVQVFVNDILLTEPTDYTIDFPNWYINLIDDTISTDSVRINVFNPFHAFDALPFAEPNPAETTTAPSGDVTATGVFLVKAHYVDTGDNILDHVSLEVGDTAAQTGEKGAILLLRSGSLGDNFPGATVNSATITVKNVISNSLTTGDKWDVMDETWVGKTTYAALSAEYLSPTTNPSVGVNNTGTVEMDATDLFAAIAALDTIDEAFVVVHEEPFPAAAGDGVYEILSVIEYEVNYTIPDPSDPPAGTLEFSFLDHPRGTIQDYNNFAGNIKDNTIGNGAINVAAGFIFPTPMRFRSHGVAQFGPLPAPGYTVATATMLFENTRWAHSDPATLPPHVKIRRLTGAMYDLLANWTVKNASESWAVGCPDTDCPADPQGGGADSDNDATPEILLLWQGEANQVVFVNNLLIGGSQLVAMVQEAIDAGQANLQVIFFVEPEATPQGSTANATAALDHLFGSADIKLTITGS
jgi:hypothetical protein